MQLTSLLPQASSSVSLRPLVALLTILITSPVFATDLSTQKLFGKWTRAPTNYNLGGDRNTAAISSKWIAVGAQDAEESILSVEGAVQVYIAATGARVRKLLPPGTPAAEQRVGGAVAISGDLAVIGASATSASPGLAHIYNLALGKLIGSTTPKSAPFSNPSHLGPVRDFSIRRQVSPKWDYSFGITMQFESQADYDGNTTHPDHVVFLEGRWIPEVADFQEADFVPLKEALV